MHAKTLQLTIRSNSRLGRERPGVCVNAFRGRGRAGTQCALGNVRRLRSSLGFGSAQRGKLRAGTKPAVTQVRSNSLVVSAVSNRRETRLGSLLTTLPQRIDLYFKRAKGRKLLWKGICCFSGFYVANTLTLTFGALGINDVVAGFMSVAFLELVSRVYYRTPRPSLFWEFIQWFKLGYGYALIADAFKLGS